MNTKIGHHRLKGMVMDGDTEKYCGGCERTLPLDNFHHRKGTRYAPQCTDCQKWKRIGKMYGFTRDQWLSMYEKQEGKCAICHKILSQASPSPDVDTEHCHVTGEFRGITCHRCNVTIGLVESIGLDRITSYLDRS